jgi:opacity protein-like surface antigen
MKKFLWAVLFIPVGTIAQQFHVTVRGGFTGYQGDLQSKRITLNQSNFGFGLGLKYDLNPHWSVRTEFNSGKIEGDDKMNEPNLQLRNLSFQSKITEGNLLLEYSLFDLSERNFTPYAFAGLAIFHFNPYAYDTLGNKIFLKPLSTEGQGLPQYPDRKEYKLTQMAIPFGAGFRYRIADNITIGYELGMRKTRTDFLDDASTSYVDEFILAQERGPKAVEMAFRGDELKNSTATYPLEGELRGGSDFKDWYYFHGITLTVGLNNKPTGKGRKGDVRCPKPVL